MTLDDILLKTMHFWAGLALRGIIGLVDYSYLKIRRKKVEDRTLEKLTRRYIIKETVKGSLGFVVPALDTFGEFNMPEYKALKDDLVSKITHAPSIEPTVEDATGDFLFFMLGYYVYDLARLGIKGYKKRKK